mmetsp:Transcript_54921/g.66145  ORF Transcript_54921/g.66145 Transcript_54921/m.66145 type:complete len:537 (+) Transcript_54921:105-1715(+)
MSLSVYQVDFKAATAGKTLAITKRRVGFRFGFANSESYAQGLTGAECRGQEHEVILIWSIVSGKRLVIFDKKILHQSVTKHNKTSDFYYTFSFGQGHEVQLIARALPPRSSRIGQEKMRQYDMVLNGLSFFNFDPIYQLGIKNPTHHHEYSIFQTLPSAANERVSPVSSPTTERALSPVKVTASPMIVIPTSRITSTMNITQQINSPSMVTDRSIYENIGDASNLYPKSVLFPSTPNQNFKSHPHPIPNQEIDIISANHIGQDFLSTPESTIQDECYEDTWVKEKQQQFHENYCGTMQKDESYLSQQNKHQITSTAIMSAYDLNSKQTDYRQSIDCLDRQIASTVSMSFDDDTDISNKKQNLSGKVDVPLLTMNPHIHGSEVTEDDLSALDKALKNLVNIDDIKSDPEGTIPTELTMIPKEDPKCKSKGRKKGQSRGIPPVNGLWYQGISPSLNEMKSTMIPKASTSEIMNKRSPYTHQPSETNNGALVVYGSVQTGNGATDVAFNRISHHHQMQFYTKHKYQNYHHGGYRYNYQH